MRASPYPVAVLHGLVEQRLDHRQQILVIVHLVEPPQVEIDSDPLKAIHHISLSSGQSQALSMWVSKGQPAPAYLVLEARHHLVVAAQVEIESKI
jgi:hypothetical protein